MKDRKGEVKRGRRGEGRMGKRKGRRGEGKTEIRKNVEKERRGEGMMA